MSETGSVGLAETQLFLCLMVYSDNKTDLSSVQKRLRVKTINSVDAITFKIPAQVLSIFVLISDVYHYNYEFSSIHFC